MIGSFVALVAGGALLGVSLKRHVFVRLLVRALSAQYRFQRRLPNLIEFSERSFFDTARVVAIVLGGLMLVLGLVGVVVIARP